MLKGFKRGALGAVLTVATAAVVTAQDASPIDTRIANFREIGTAFKQIGDELKSKQPALPRIEGAARMIQTRGAGIAHWFPKGSEPPPPVETSWLDRIRGWLGLGGAIAMPDEVKTQARIDILREPEQFQAAQRTFMREADSLAQIAQRKDIGSIRTSFKALGRTCESCHEKFREE